MVRARQVLVVGLILLFACCSWLHAEEKIDRLLDRVHQVVAPLVEELKQNPRDALLQAKIGSYYAKAKLWPEARAYFQAAVQLQPDNSLFHSRFGLILWKQGDQDRAVEEWLAALDLDPDGEAKKLLAEYSPGHLTPPVEVPGVEEFLEVARFQQDFRRQAEVQRALTTFNIRKATRIILAPVNSRSIIEDLHTHGYLDRAGGPPSGLGEYLYDEQGKIYSTEYGSQDRPRGGPEALRSPRGYKASPEAVLEAMSRGKPEAFEFGFVHLGNQDIQTGLERIARGAEQLRDPWALDKLLSMLLLRSRAVDDPVPACFEKFLGGLVSASTSEPLHRWQAMALLYLDGHRDFSPLGEAEMDRLLDAAYRREVPKQAALAALDALGSGSEDYLVRLLAADRATATGLGGAFMAMPRYGRGKGFRAMIEVLERDGWKWNYWKPHALKALGVMAGKDLGEDPAVWRQAAEELYGS